MRIPIKNTQTKQERIADKIRENMKTLLIISNKANNIGIIQDINQDNPTFFHALDSHTKDKTAFKSYIFSLMPTNEYFIEFGEKPDFQDIINENQIKAVFTYFEDIQRISFALKQNILFKNYDLEDFLKTNSFESLQSIFQEEVNGNLNKTNQGSLQTNGERGGLSKRDSENRKSNRATQSDNEQGIANSYTNPRESILFGEGGGSKGNNPNDNKQEIPNEAFGIPQSTNETKHTLLERGESTKLQNKEEQREGELWNGGRQGENPSLSTNTESHHSISNKSTQKSQQHLSLPPNQLNSFNERKIAFRERIRAILESKRIKVSTKQLLSQFKIQSNATKDQDSGIREDENRDNGESQSGESPRDDRGTKESELDGDSELESERGETTRADNGLFESGISTPKQESPSSTGFSEISDIIPTSTGDKQGDSSVSEQLSNVSNKESENNRLDSAPSNTEIQGEQSAPNQANISQEELSGNVIREYNMEFQNGSEESGGDRLIEDNTQGTQDKQGIATDEHRSLFETNPDISTRADETGSAGSDELESQESQQEQDESLEPLDITESQPNNLVESLIYGDENLEKTEPIFETFNDFNLLKKLKGEEYKGEIDFNLSKKERIEANFKALVLVKEIFQRKKRIDDVRYRFNNIEENINAIQLEIIENDYFSDDIPMTRTEQETLAKYTGFGGLSDFFFDESFSN